VKSCAEARSVAVTGPDTEKNRVMLKSNADSHDNARQAVVPVSSP
jgi:hypothetical protein